MPKDFFPPRPEARPIIYAYEDTHPQYAGLLKIGYTTRTAVERVTEQYPTARPGELPFRIIFEESAMRNDGSTFTDREIHRCLHVKGFKNPKGEWFACSAQELRAVYLSVKSGTDSEEGRTLDFAMRPEQRDAVENTAAYFNDFKRDKSNKGKTPHFLWNAKMRFGKTFAAYQLAKKMGWEKVLVLTFKPAVQSAWEGDIKYHVDFADWQFISPAGLSYEAADKKKPFVCFGSFQDYLGKNKNTGGIKTKNEWVHTTHWDCVVLDEYHYGAWREKARDLFESEEKDEVKFAQGEGAEFLADVNEEIEDILPVSADHYLYLSGTPFRAIASGEFIEEQIFNWTYSDEQRAKANWNSGDNPYAMLPRMVLLTYQLPDSIREIAMQGEFNEFDLNVFFSAKGQGMLARFKYEEEVQKWLDLIRGAFLATAVDNLKLGAKKPPMPFSDTRLLNVLSHTFWFLPSVAACHAMNNLLKQKQNRFYHDYQIIVAAGSEAGVGVNALQPVQEAMDDPLKSRTITLSCMKLTTGITVRPWTGIFMLRNLSTPETYFQAAFRVQSPWTVKNPDGLHPNAEEIIKRECYVFDFAPNRALRLITDYATRLNVNEAVSPENKVAEFINFLPVLAYDGSLMKQIDAAGILDIATSGTTATLLARRWESALLANVDNETLSRLMANQQAMDALMSIEGFRNLNQDIETIINKSEAVKKIKREANERELTKKEKKELTDDEKEYKSKRKLIQTKLIKFSTRIPIFMYLTDYRERTLRDVITLLEPRLFKRVTGLEVKDFELLVSLNVFNGPLMNDAVYKFKRYEDSSLAYTGVNKHEDDDVGLYDTVLRRQDYQTTFMNEPIENYEASDKEKRG
ncbi:restriction endonuclease [Candidatus Brocadia sapporoensis]|uniref:Restriction endonuclease n=1 Tax=Candidatus Brocadia sapporoensis TaxID=392547 RepID=A0A1V6LY59_9BACT|nr:GIY-YIG nuclease family protein [Candidatus Brocadia sapporoensis]OQD45078.1 restriction endonuclease [Candidatus Brocadia sapporoensis]GJQ23674.1 MAG: type III restriction endonuclease [Candidatus Brocadia sapporoensis]